MSEECCGGGDCAPQEVALGTPAFDQVIDSSHKYTDVLSTSDRTVGGAHTMYAIRTKEGQWLAGFPFQDGPIKEAGVNGVMDENLIAIVIDRLKGFQAGPYACIPNAVALTALEGALEALQSRTKDREARGVEGTHQQ